jgi:hypothetical protein
MQEIAGEYTPFGGKLVGKLPSGPNLLLQNEDDEENEEMFQDENNETNQMI